ncbi:hypothetical protein [Levilactobacillus spicheri]|uniref:Uncharacterized protein n=1 Tax=Levilactobacillus spicheri TaxID=216463 RepID=A0A0F3RSU6_9LACO|nr:hypothetical protein [Levilactobacillus spicheri]KJW13066.1 hypothetical protein VC81_04830 [Levilactobacillus spicheri]
MSAQQRRLDGRGEIDVGRGSFPAYIKAEFWRSAILAELQNRAHLDHLARRREANVITDIEAA